MKRSTLKKSTARLLVAVMLLSIWLPTVVLPTVAVVTDFEKLNLAIIAFNGGSGDMVIEISGEIEVEETLNITNTSDTLTITGGELKRYVGDFFDSTKVAHLGSFFFVDEDATLILQGVTIDGSLDVNDINPPSGSPVPETLIFVAGTFEMETDAVLKDNILIADLGEERRPNNGGAVIIAGGGEFNMKGGTISGNKANVGAAVAIAENGEFNMNGGTISGNTTEGSGGAVAIAENGTFNMSGGTISDNESGWWGGAVVVSGAFYMSGTAVITDNNAETGGAVYVGADGAFIMGGGTISSNEADTFGGAVYIRGGLFMDCTCDDSCCDPCLCDGDSVCENCVFSSGTFDMEGGTISGNEAGWDGGAVYISDGTFTMSDGTVSGNEAERGGAVYVSDGTFDMEGGTISVNEADTGGAVYIGGGIFAMTGGEITDNVSTDKSGAVFVEGDGTFSLGDALIEDNDGIKMTGGSLILSDDITLREQICIVPPGPTEQPTVLIDGKNKSIKRGIAGDLITIDASTLTEDRTGTLTLKDIILDGNNAVAPYATNGGGSLVRAVGADVGVGEVILDGTVLQNNIFTGGTGGGVFVDGYGKLTMNADSIIRGNTAEWGGGVYVGQDGEFTMKANSVIRGNTADENGGGVYVGTDVEFTMNGIIEENEAEEGGGVYVYVAGELIMLPGSRISGNLAEYGGGVYLSHNEFASEGGAFTMRGGEISFNTATEFGGGVIVRAESTFDMVFGAIGFNEALMETVVYEGGHDVDVNLDAGGVFTMQGGAIANFEDKIENAVYIYDELDNDTGFAFPGSAGNGILIAWDGVSKETDTGLTVYSNGVEVDNPVDGKGTAWWVNPLHFMDMGGTAGFMSAPDAEPNEDCGNPNCECDPCSGIGCECDPGSGNGNGNGGDYVYVSPSPSAEPTKDRDVVYIYGDGELIKEFSLNELWADTEGLAMLMTVEGEYEELRIDVPVWWFGEEERAGAELVVYNETHGAAGITAANVAALGDGAETVSYLLVKGSVALSALADGTELEDWYAYGAPVVLGLPGFDPEADADGGDWVAVRVLADGTEKIVPLSVLRGELVTVLAASAGTYDVRANPKAFGDVSGWATAAIKFAAARGIVAGVGDGLFAPERAVTRAEFVTMLVQMLGIDSVQLIVDSGELIVFEDVLEGAWYYEHVMLAAALGVTAGVGGGKFAPDRVITREEMLTMACAALAKYGLLDDTVCGLEHCAGECGEEGCLAGYTDVDDVSAFALDAVTTMVCHSLIVGTGTGDTLSPKSAASRAEAAQFIANAVRYVVPDYSSLIED
ncbi:MAG: S-layer homology domain-containing protein [Oscillospiraceae bacterium]|nr:S-layer homology domain-containing protein [Oscillospiraceae bacterium]